MPGGGALALPGGGALALPGGGALALPEACTALPGTYTSLPRARQRAAGLRLTAILLSQSQCTALLNTAIR